MFSIGTLAKAAGVKVPTIRYYEGVGLVAPAGRSQGNQRRYEPEALERLTFIRHARELGLSLDAIRDLISLSRHPDEPCDRADAIVADQLASVRRRIARLKRLEGELARIASSCGGHAVADCAVLAALGDHGQCETEH